MYMVWVGLGELGEWALELVDKISQPPIRESPQPWWCLFSGAMICRRSRSPSAARLKAEFGARPDQWNGRRKSCWRKINTVERRHDTLQITAIYRAHKGGIEGKRAAAELLLYCLSSRDYRSPPAFCQHLIFPKLGENCSQEKIPMHTKIFFQFSLRFSFHMIVKQVQNGQWWILKFVYIRFDDFFAPLWGYVFESLAQKSMT